MPELPEVETIVRDLRQSLIGRVLGRTRAIRKDIIHGAAEPIEQVLPGRRIENITRRAKRIVFELDGPTRMVVHLGMSGRLLLMPTRRAVAKHTHLRIAIRGVGLELRFVDPRRFGGVWLVSEKEGPTVGRVLGPLGPEPLDLSPARFARLLRRRRQIKALLLDQRMIAGMGNIYCDEALHGAQVHPVTAAETLNDSEAKRLLRVIKSTLNKAIRLNGSTMMDYRRANGDPGSFQNYHRVYQRAGQPCKKCGTQIERITVAGRSSFFCPACQRLRV